MCSPGRSSATAINLILNQQHTFNWNLLEMNEVHSNFNAIENEPKKPNQIAIALFLFGFKILQLNKN